MANDYEERFNRIERNLAFVAEHQAKFSADIGRIDATLDRIAASLGRHNEAINGLLRISQTLFEHQKAAEVRMARIEEKMAEMAQAHREGEERLSAFITFVEKYISSHNGH